MRKISLVLVALVLVVSPSARAGFFDRKPKPNPADRVPELINTLKNDPSAGKRKDAAEELRQFDGLMFPEIVPMLIEALQKDPSSSVRCEAAQSLGRIKPHSLEASQALEAAIANDPSYMVRLQARTSHLGYKVPAPAPSVDSQGASKPSPDKPSSADAPPAPIQLTNPPTPVPSPLIPNSRPLPRPTGAPTGPVLIPPLPGLAPAKPNREESPVTAPKPIKPASLADEPQGPVLIGPQR